MTTTVIVHCNGRYAATVRQTKVDGTVLPDVVVKGDYPGTPNPGGRMSFNIGYPATSLFEVIEHGVDESAPDHRAEEVRPEAGPITHGGEFAGTTANPDGNGTEPEPAFAASTQDDGAKTDATADQTD